MAERPPSDDDTRAWAAEELARVLNKPQGKRPLAFFLNQALLDYYAPSPGMPLHEVLEACADIASVYMSRVEDPLLRAKFFLAFTLSLRSRIDADSKL